VGRHNWTDQTLEKGCGEKKGGAEGVATFVTPSSAVSRLNPICSPRSCRNIGGQGPGAGGRGPGCLCPPRRIRVRAFGYRLCPGWEKGPLWVWSGMRLKSVNWERGVDIAALFEIVPVPPRWPTRNSVRTASRRRTSLPRGYTNQSRRSGGTGGGTRGGQGERTAGIWDSR